LDATCSKASAGLGSYLRLILNNPTIVRIRSA
jgi:hypothetical protein